MTLTAFLTQVLAAPVDRHVQTLGGMLAGDDTAVDAVLFYGSNLRTGSLDGILDFYVLQAGPREHGIWPRVSYREVVVDGTLLRAKIATMRLATFTEAAADHTIDTTIWARFAQPSALIWTRDAAAERRVIAAVAAAAVTASRYAAALGPGHAESAVYWRSLFAATYAAELRVEQGRADELVERDRPFYDALLPLAWIAGGVPFDQVAGEMRIMLPAAWRRRLRLAWVTRRLAGKPINIARLVRATTTFTGASRYAAWKIKRHTGIDVILTPWQERHPVLAAPAVLWRVWRLSAR